jgi:aryl-alcohol dehydrogenase-like predicted oxidoreductase
VKKIKLNNTGLKVSKLCFGTGRMQHLSSKEGGRLLKNALKKGINFWDTSDDYDTHRHVREGLRGIKRGKVVLMSKITCIFDRNIVIGHIENMLKELGTSYLDIILLHAVDSEKELKKYLNIISEIKKSKKIKHIGISSHKPSVLQKIVKNNDIKFVLAPLNYKGLRIKSNGFFESLQKRKTNMVRVLRECRKNGKDVFLIKVFGNNKIKDIKKATNYCLSQKFSDGIDIGITSEEELNEDVRLVNKFTN